MYHTKFIQAVFYFYWPLHKVQWSLWSADVEPGGEHEAAAEGE